MDSNVIIRAAANPSGASADCLASIRRGDLACVYSHTIVTEYKGLGTRRSVARLLARRPGSGGRLAEFVEMIVAAAELVVPTGDAPPCRDENDRMYLHCAVAASCDYLVTFDEDLLEIGSIGLTRIVSPASLITLLQGER